MSPIESIANLTRESIANLTHAELKAQIRCRGGHVQDRAKSMQYLRTYLWDLREVKPNVVYVPKKRRNYGVSKPVAPVQTVQVVAPVQTVQVVAPVQTVQVVAPVQTVQVVAPVQTVQVVAPVQTVQVVASVQTIELYSQTAISANAVEAKFAEVFGFLPLYDA
jgi:hypothetical protein